MKTFEQQIELFKEQTDLQLEIVDGKPYYDGNIHIHNNNTNAITFPDSLIVKGNLTITSGFASVTLPKELIVDGFLCIDNINTKRLPEKLVVKGDLDVKGTDVTELPSDMNVGGSIWLCYTKIKQLPENLTINGYLDISNTGITELPRGLVIKQGFYFSNTKIKELPEDIVIGGSLCAESSSLEKLPESLKIIKGFLNISRTNVTQLPDNLVVRDNLSAKQTNIKELPKGLIVYDNLLLDQSKVKELPDDIIIGGNLYINYTNIEKLPDNLKVGSFLDMTSTKIGELPNDLQVGYLVCAPTHITEKLQLKHNILCENFVDSAKYVKNYIEWEHKSSGRKFCKADGIFTEILEEKGNVKKVKQLDDNEELYLVTDGNGNYAHGKTIQEAKDDLLYKISNRDKSDYEGLTLDSVLTHKEAIVCYRVITGACSAGTKGFVENILGDKRKDEYTIQEMIDLTRGQYGNKKFENFFKS